MPLQIEACQERTITVIQLQGEAVDGDASRLRQLLGDQLEAGENKLILAVDGLGQIDTSCLSVLVDLQAQAEQGGGDIRLAGARSALLAHLATYGAEQKFAKFDNVDAAVTSFNGVDSRGVKHFDILEFVKEQEREDKAQADQDSLPEAASNRKS